MSSKTYRTIGIIGLSLLLVAGIISLGLFLISTTTSTGSIENQNSSTTPLAGKYNPPEKGPVLSVMNLEGSWTMKNENGSSFNAIVDGDSIKITMDTPSGTSAVYWNGTFGPYQYNGAEFTSMVIDDGRPILSQSESKVFTVGPDSLTFKFTAMGVTKTVELRRV